MTKQNGKAFERTHQNKKIKRNLLITPLNSDRMKKLAIAIIGWMTVLNAFSQDLSALRDSLAVVTDSLGYHPQSVDLRLRKAGYNLQLDQWQYAKEEYDYILKRHPHNVAALYFRAYANQRLNRLHFAKLDYENVLRIVPTNFEARLGLSLLCQKMGRLTEALDHANILVIQHPDSSIAYAARAGIEEERHFLNQADEDYTEAIQREPANTDYLLNRALVRIRLKRKPDALEDLNRLVSLGIPRYALAEYFKQCR